MWCRIHTNPVLRCFMNPERLSYEDMLNSVVPEPMSRLTV
jgi:hypothetical protein